MQLGPTCSGFRSSRPISFLRSVGDQTATAVVVADAGRGDWVLCQVTSKAYADVNAVGINEADFAQGSLRLASFARPGKLFTANAGLVEGNLGVLQREALRRIVNAVIAVIEASSVKEVDG